MLPACSYSVYEPGVVTVCPAHAVRHLCRISSHFMQVREIKGPLYSRCWASLPGTASSDSTDPALHLCAAGRDRSMLIPNVLFRANGSAVLLTNKAKHVRRAKYSIPHIVRTNLASNDVAFNCVIQTEDAERKLGVRLNKDLIQVGFCRGCC